MKLYSVQYLRGLAAILVLIAHSLSLPLKVETYDYIRLGRLGVLMFFVISGFIMVLIAGEGRFDPLGFLRRRVMRVVPLYWLATFAVAALTIAAPQIFKTAAFTPSHLILSMLFVPHFAPNGEQIPILRLGWTLNYEMFFYVCFALLAALSAGRRLALLSLLFVVLATIGSVVHPVGAVASAYTHYFLLAFCVGGWVGYATLKGWRFGGTTGQAMLLIATAIVALVLAWGLQRPERGTEPVAAAMTVASAALLLLGIARENDVRHSPLLARIGDASYSIYLSHMYVVGAVMVIVRRVIGDDGYWLMVVGGIVGGATVGVLVFAWVERPLLRLLQRPARAARPAEHPAVAVPRDGDSPGLTP